MGKDAQALSEVGMDEVIRVSTEGGDPEGGTKGTGPSGEGGGAEEFASEFKGETFYDPNVVPIELRPTFREMQKANTQKNQAMAAKVKEAEEHVHRAGLFDNLVADERVVGFLKQLDAADRGEGPTPGGVDSEDPDLDPAVQAAIAKAIKPVQEQLLQTRQKLQVSDEKTTFIAAHPDYETYMDGMQEAWKQNPARSMEDAYNWAFRQSYLGKVESLEKKRAASKASVETGGSSVPTVRTAKINNFKDAVRAALEEHGMRRQDFGV